MKKVLLFILKFLVSIFILAFGLTLTIFIFHKVKSLGEYNTLKKEGFINLYPIDDYHLNIYRIGKKNSSHKIIGISGLGVNDYNVRMSFVNKVLEEDYELIYIDRAGYGYSDDNNKKQTVKRIVNDYREALKKANIEEPYILMPHSIGGVYATYWESMYPNEIESVIFIDSTVIEPIKETSNNKKDYTEYLELLSNRLGLQRLALRTNYPQLPSRFSKKEQKYSDYLNIKGSMNKAIYSETKLHNTNINETFKNIKKNDIPKLYISSTRGAEDIIDLENDLLWITKRKKEMGLKTITKTPSKAKLEKTIKENKKWEINHLKPYTDLLGNTTIEHLSGDHFIFEQKPNELTDIIKDYIDDLDKQNVVINNADDDEEPTVKHDCLTSIIC